MTGAEPLEEAAWRLAVGTLAPEDLPELATDALVRGLDSPALRVLAGQPRDDVRDSADLRSDLARWDERFQAMFSRWPAAGGFESELDAEQFVAEGQRLVSQLQDELGASYQVEYMPEPIRPPSVRLRGQSR